MSAITAVEREARLPTQLLGTIALVESGRPSPGGRVAPWPWTINVAGTGHFYATKEEAISAVQLYKALGVASIDVGCMQINLLHHPAAFASLDEAFDPRANVVYGARFLGGLYRQSKVWPQAVAAYHSQTPAFGAEYWNRIMARWTLASRFTDGKPLPGGAVPVVAAVQPKVNPNYTPEFAARVREMEEDHRRNMISAGTGDARGEQPSRPSRSTGRAARMAGLN
jgi:hypothetical protein